MASDGSSSACPIIRFWTPLDYAGALVLQTSPKLTDAPTWLLWAMVVWLLPFLVFGVRFTARRAIDAGLTPWVALGFFVPFGNYVLMLALCLLPRAERRLHSPEAVASPPAMSRVRVLVLPPLAGAVLGVVVVALAVYMLRSYGAGLFLALPFVVATVSAYLRVRFEPESSAFDAAVSGLLAVGGIAALCMLVAMEGAICMLMAAPLAIVLGLAGSNVGRLIAQREEGSPRHIGLGLMALPLALMLEPAPGAHPIAREVLTTIEIDAPPDAVWPHVVAFRPLPDPTDWLSRAGIAYPMSARIIGSGVGAVRYCEFSTGAFVEPITAWEPGRRLAFDVTSSPRPLRELSPYVQVDAPHLDDFLRSRRGEFRLIALAGGRTRLEGRTWYELEMAPEGYWRLIADWLIHRIHERVLGHIRREAE